MQLGEIIKLGYFLFFFFYKFLAKNTNLSTFSGLREALWHETMFPQALKTLSDGELVVGTHRYFLANFN